MIHEIVNALQFVREQLVVVAEFQELRVGVFEELDRRAPRLVVIEERGVPSDYGEVVWVVRDLRLEDFLPLAVGERLVFSAHDLGDASAFGGEQVGCWTLPAHSRTWKMK